MAGRVAIIGAGDIGTGWAVRFLRAGWTVQMFDPDRKATENICTRMRKATAEGPLLLGRAGVLETHRTLSSAVHGVDWVQESVPERVALKRTVYAAVQAQSGAPIASSSEGIGPVDLQLRALRPQQIIKARPIHPVEIMPLVEIEIGGAVTDDLVDQALDVYRSMAMSPVHLRGTAAGKRGAVMA